jgi:Zn-finger protein
MNIMSIRMVEIVQGRFLWRCDDCGWEHPRDPVPKHKLPSAPVHHCPKSKQKSSNGKDDEVMFDDLRPK